MKQNMEKRVLKVVAEKVKADMKRQQGSTSICPVFFHQPKRPKKSVK